MPKCLQQQLISSRVVMPRGCNEETEGETGKTQRKIKRERGNEEIQLKRCQLEKGRVDVLSRKETCVPCYLHIFYGCSASKMTRPESFLISSV